MPLMEDANSEKQLREDFYRATEARINQAVAENDKNKLKALIGELQHSHLDSPWLLSKCLVGIGDSDMVKEFYRKEKDEGYFFLQAFFLVKKGLAFDGNGSIWDFTEGTDFWKKFESWSKERDCEAKGMDGAKFPKVVSALEKFIENSKKPRAAIAVANSGLYGGFLAKGMGIDTYVVDSHRKGKGASYKELDDFNVIGKDVLLIDNDMETGRTISRVAREISAKKPRTISFLFYHTPNIGDILDKLRNMGHIDSRLYETDKFPESPNTLDLIDKIEKQN